MSRAARAVIAAAAVSSEAGTTGRAATIDWTNPAGGTFQTGANWSGGVAPGSADVARFSALTPIDVTLGAAVMNQQMIVQSGADVTWYGSPFNYVATSGIVSGVLIGDTVSGTPARLQVASGNIGAFDIVLADVVASSAIVSAQNGSWGASRQCIIGNAGDGTLTTTNEFVNVNRLSLGETPGAHGFMQTSAGFFGPTNLQVGRAGTGTLRITNGTDIGTGSVVIGDGVGSVGTIDLVSNVEWGNGTLIVGNAGSGTMLVGAGTMTDSGGANIARLAGSRGYLDFNGGSMTMFRALNVGGTDTAAGGTATFSLTNGSLTVFGALRVWDRGHAHWQNGNLVAGSIELNGGGTMTVAAGASAKLLKTAKLTIDLVGASKLDLSDNDAMFTASNGALIESYIKTARNGGDWLGAGLTSSAAAAQPHHVTSLGILSGAEYKAVNGLTFDGATVADADVLVKYTYYGDVDFNGVVDFDDYSHVDAGFNNNRTGWLNGDLDYNGIVDFDDYSLIDLAFNTQAGTLRQALTFLDSEDRITAVPEPSSVAMISALSVLTSRRRRHRASLRLPAGKHEKPRAFAPGVLG